MESLSTIFLKSLCNTLLKFILASSKVEYLIKHEALPQGTTLEDAIYILTDPLNCAECIASVSGGDNLLVIVFLVFQLRCVKVRLTDIMHNLKTAGEVRYPLAHGILGAERALQYPDGGH